MQRWFAERVDVALPGGRYRFWGKHTLGAPGEPEAQQAITRLEPGRSLGYSWRLYGVPTTVDIALVAEGDVTRLTLHHRVEGELPLSRPKELIDDHWKLAFGNLAAHLAGGSGIVRPDYTDPAPEVRLSITIDAPREAVFRALLDPATITRWFDAAEAVVEPRQGGRYSLGWKYQVDGRDVMGGPTKILELVPNEKLVLDWPDWRGDTSVSDYPFGWVYFMAKLGEVFQGEASR